ncbi:MAG: ribosomal protein S18-alanine N-acetyltransferase [Clostridia bacterium]
MKIALSNVKSIDEICKSKNAICRVCLDGDNVVGYYTLYDVCDEGCVNNIAVLKSRQGVGLGNILMQDMIYCAKKNGVIALTLEVNINNIKAIKLYEKFGFVTEGVRKKFYNDNEDALIMWLRKL